MSYQYVLPGEIEKRSFEILTKELGDRKLLPENEPVIKRVIHTTADFDYVDNLVFSDGAVTKAVLLLLFDAGSADFPVIKNQILSVIEEDP